MNPPPDHASPQQQTTKQQPEGHSDDSNGAAFLKASPRPWSLALLEASATRGDAAAMIPQLRFVYWDKAKWLHPDDAALIVAAVNAFSRLRGEGGELNYSVSSLRATITALLQDEKRGCSPDHLNRVLSSLLSPTPLRPTPKLYPWEMHAGDPCPTMEGGEQPKPFFAWWQSLSNDEMDKMLRISAVDVAEFAYVAGVLAARLSPRPTPAEGEQSIALWNERERPIVIEFAKERGMTVDQLHKHAVRKYQASLNPRPEMSKLTGELLMEAEGSPRQAIDAALLTPPPQAEHKT